MTEPAAALRYAVKSQRTWWAPGALIAVLAGAVAMLWPTIGSLRAEWEDTNNLTYTHGYLIALISAWLLWRARPLSANIRVASEPRMLPVLAVLSFAWLLGYRANIVIAHQVLLPLIGWSAIYAAFGWPVARRCAFAFAFLYFAVPIWSFGNEALQSLTVIVVRLLLQVASIPAYVTGNLVHIPSGVFEIAGGCSGLHFFIVALAIGTLYGEIHNDRWRVRLATVGLAMGLAMITNWIRVFTLIVLGHATEMQHHLVSVEHYTFGWVLFACAMLVFFFIARYLPVAPESNQDQAENSPHRAQPSIRGAVAALLALSFGPVWSALAPDAVAQSERASSMPKVNGWQGPIHGLHSEWSPIYEGADRQEQAEYRAADLRVQMFSAAYDEQRQGKELIGFRNTMLGDLADVSSSNERLHGPHGSFNQSILTTREGRQAVVLYYYQVGPHHTASASRAQLLYGWQSLFSIPISKAIGAHATCASNCESERAALLDFLSAMREAS
jgi:exosortase A